MMSFEATPAGQLTTDRLIERIQTGSVFECHAEEAELNARLQRTGQPWRFNTAGKIELYYPQKVRPGQRPIDFGLFDRGARGQLDMADFLNRKS